MTVAELVRILVGLPMNSDVTIDLTRDGDVFDRRRVDGAFRARGSESDKGEVVEISFVETTTA